MLGHLLPGLLVCTHESQHAFLQMPSPHAVSDFLDVLASDFVCVPHDCLVHQLGCVMHSLQLSGLALAGRLCCCCVSAAWFAQQRSADVAELR